MRISAGLVMVFAFLRVAPCRAEAPSYELEYVADAACPAQPQFERLVDYYLEGEVPAPGAYARVSLRLNSARAEGTFTLQRRDGSVYTRDLGAATCDDVAPALAFVLAYALSGRSSEPSSVGDGASPRLAPLPPRAVAARPEPAAPTEDRAPPARPQSGLRFGMGMALGARTGLGPIWTPVEGARLEARRDRAGDPLVLAVVASVLRDETVTRIDRNGTTSFAWLAGRLDLCPLRLELTTELGLLPCAGTHVGRLVATGDPTVGSGRTAAKLWVDAAFAARLELRLWRVLALETQAELLFPLTPYRFAFDSPDTPVYQVPRVAAAAFVGLGVHFL
jgi:hypothetical protein